MKRTIRHVLLATSLLLGAPALLHADLDLGSPASRTPYDQYLGPMRAVFERLNGKADMSTASELVREGRGFRYSYNKAQPYIPQTPDVTESTKAGDCKAKSLWLASKMNDRAVRYVIGKAKAGQSMSHAWLIWDGPEGWMILDATLYSTPLSPERLSRNQFVPIYSYSPSGRYSHAVAAGGPESKNGDHL